MDGIMIIILLLFIIYKYGYNKGYNHGKKNTDEREKELGYKLGKSKIENEVFELSKENDNEIVKRIKNFAKNYKKL